MNGCFQANILAVNAIVQRQVNLTYIQGLQLIVWVVSLLAMDLSTHCLTPDQMSQHSEFVWNWQAMKPPHPISSSTSTILFSRLHLNAFRGVRAISMFDWPFTPTHNSSKHFSTCTGSVLHCMLLQLQPAHGQITRFRVYPHKLVRPIQTRFRFGSGP